MATNFPGSLDGYTTKVDNVDDVLAAHVNNLQDAVTALQTKIGSDDSNISASIDYFLKNASGSFKTHTHNGTNSTKVSLLNLHESDIPSLSQGDLLYYNGSNLVKLAKATTGHVLRGGNTPVWAEEAISTDATFADNSDILYPSQKATKTYIDSKLTGNRFTAYNETSEQYTTITYGTNTWGAHPTTSLSTDISGVVLISNMLYLPAGEYYIKGYAMAYNLGTTSLKVSSHLGDITLRGPTGVPILPSYISSPNGVNVMSFIEGYIILPTESYVVFRQYHTVSSGFCGYLPNKVAEGIGNWYSIRIDGTKIA